MPDAPDTVTEAIALLEAEGFTDAVELRSDGLACSSCGRTSSLDDVRVDRVLRFEGASDPDDEMIVLGVACPACGARGVVVAAYGVDVDADQAEALRRLAAGR